MVDLPSSIPEDDVSEVAGDAFAGEKKIRSPQRSYELAGFAADSDSLGDVAEPIWERQILPLDDAEASEYESAGSMSAETASLHQPSVAHRPRFKWVKSVYRGLSRSAGRQENEPRRSLRAFSKMFIGAGDESHVLTALPEHSTEGKVTSSHCQAALPAVGKSKTDMLGGLGVLPSQAASSLAQGAADERRRAKCDSHTMGGPQKFKWSSSVFGSALSAYADRKPRRRVVCRSDAVAAEEPRGESGDPTMQRAPTKASSPEERSPTKGTLGTASLASWEVFANTATDKFRRICD